ncbi:MAG: MerR family transcriptional regulator [Actinomycetota bacterium]|jgi:Na+-transporting methylmalonyl-CoA/oxaloacetate decarboxylase gamma subunit|nr:MerR family transcriptional regulator [Actinomycetota bacterium]
MEMRVEELARLAGTSVDTVRYYQTKRLIPPPRRRGRVALYDDHHLERILRVRSLQARGFRLATIARLVAGDLDAADEALVAEVSGISRLPGATGASPAGPPVPATPAAAGEMLSLADLAARASVPLPLLAAIEAEGLLVPRRMGTRDVYTDEDVAVAGHALTLLEWGIPLPDLLDLARRHHAATEALADDAVRLFSTSVRRVAKARASAREASGAHGDEVSAAAYLVQAYTELLAAVTALVAHHFTRVLVRTALEHIEDVGSGAELEAIHEHRLGGDPVAGAAVAS